METENNENMISYIYQFRNKLNALLGDDPTFTIYEIDEPLPDGTIERRTDGRTLNVVCSDVTKLVIARAHIGETYVDGQLLYIDYYYSRDNKSKSFLNIKDRPASNTNLDIAMLFEGNPHFSKLYSGWNMFGPWFCVAFKPELIQYRTDNATALHGRRSCAMEDIAREVFTQEQDSKIRFSTENKEDCPTIADAIYQYPTISAYNSSTTGSISGLSTSLTSRH